MRSPIAALRNYAPVALALAALSSGALGTGCGSSLPQPKAVPNTAAAYTEVPYPPPAARIEFMPKEPKAEDGKHYEWADGEWRFRGKRWRWTNGGWYNVPQGTRLAHWAVVVRSDGQMLFAPSQWQDASGKPLATAPTPVQHALSNVTELDEPETVRAEPAVHGPDLPANPAAVAGSHASSSSTGSTGSSSDAHSVSPP